MYLCFKAGKECLEEGVFGQINDGPPRAGLRFSMHEPELGTHQAGLELLVSKVCASEHGAGRAREGSTRGQERLVG